MRANTTGSINTATGKDALKSNTTGYENTALGQGALDSTTTGYRNIGVGNNAGDVITTGNNKTLLLVEMLILVLLMGSIKLLLEMH